MVILRSGSGYSLDSSAGPFSGRHVGDRVDALWRLLPPKSWTVQDGNSIQLIRRKNLIPLATFVKVASPEMIRIRKYRGQVPKGIEGKLDETCLSVHHNKNLPIEYANHCFVAADNGQR